MEVIDKSNAFPLVDHGRNLAAGLARSQHTKQRLHEYVTALAEQKKFSGSVLVSKVGEVLLGQVYGMANYEFDFPNTDQTKLRIVAVIPISAPFLASLRQKIVTKYCLIH